MNIMYLRFRPSHQRQLSEKQRNFATIAIAARQSDASRRRAQEPRRLSIFRCRVVEFSARMIKKEPADKPGSVVGNHSSGIAVTSDLKRPTRESVGRRFCAHEVYADTPLFGLAPGGVYRAAACYQPRGALLPHHFTLTRTVAGSGGIFSVALSVGSRPPGITWHPVRRSPDFPPETDAETSARAIAWPAPGATIDQASRRHKPEQPISRLLKKPANPWAYDPSTHSPNDMPRAGRRR